MSETNWVANIIANEADKALGVRPDGTPKPHDIAAAEVITATYLLIPRSELPKTSIIDRDGKPHIEVMDAEAGTWPAKNSHAQNRKWGLEYLAASEAMKEWQAERRLSKRRDELASEFTDGRAGDSEGYMYSSEPMRKAIDRIIELEARDEVA